jgi:NAD(P)-dependent dehydrogenase (short-subunit alcohol dehydrogenase family)
MDSEVVVITGASAGLGRAIARAFARRGARLGLLARGRERLEDTEREVRALGGDAVALPTDVADPEAVEAAASAVESRLGPIDVWINNAMTSVFSPVIEMRPDEYRRVTEVTYLGTVYGTLAALRRMRPHNRGVVVQVGSALAYRAIPLQSAYCAAKHAIQGFTESLRSELYHEGSGIRICMVQMPALNTPQFGWVRSRLPRKAQPVPPIFQPEVGAEAVVFAAHHPRQEMYVGGSSVLAIAGNRLAPRLLDRYLGRTGFRSQQMDEPEDPERPDNLYDPVPGHQAAHGPFGDRARRWSVQLWASEHRRALAFAGLAIAAAAILSARPSRRPAAAALRRPPAEW